MNIALDKYLPFADQPTPKPEAGQWTLTAPSGRVFVADSPIRCVQAESNSRIPAHVALGRIARSLNEPDAPLAASESVEELSTESTRTPRAAPQGGDTGAPS